MNTNFKIGDVVAYVEADDFFNDKFTIVANKETPYKVDFVERYASNDFVIVKISERLENFIDVSFSDLRGL